MQRSLKFLLFALTVALLGNSQLFGEHFYPGKSGELKVSGSIYNDTIEITSSTGTPGQLTFTVTDSNNTVPRVYTLNGITDLSIDTMSGADSIIIGGDVEIVGDLNIRLGTSSGNGFDQFKSDGGAELVVNGTFKLDLGGGLNEVNLAAGGSSMMVMGDMEIQSPRSGFNIITLVDCQIVNDLRVWGSNGFDNCEFHELMVGGDVALNLHDGGAWSTYQDFLTISNSWCGDDLEVITGRGNDSVVFNNVTVADQTVVKSSRGNDEITVTDGSYQEMQLSAGRQDDRITIQYAEIDDCRMFGYDGKDIVELFASNIRMCFFDGGDGEDTATNYNSSLGRGSGAINTEHGNLLMLD